jgi:hypothetical protein
MREIFSDSESAWRRPTFVRILSAEQAKDAYPSCRTFYVINDRRVPRASIDAARQHFALADMVRLAYHAFRFHALDDARGAVVADLQMALHEAG